MEHERQTPEQALHHIRQEELRKGRGQLKIFFGYAAGVGKTYAMLKAAHAALENGIDVIAGYIEPHERPDTAALLTGLELLPPLSVKHRGITLQEFDLNAALERKPQLILVDELAHTNADGCRHNKRYKDIEELLKAGINVFTTVNVQHIESLNDIVASITGVTVSERIPDTVFDNADFVELVDIEPKDLIERLGSGKIYRRQQAERAVNNFFTIENLTALREIALRRCADRMNYRTQSRRYRDQGGHFVNEHILVCLSPAPSNAKIIRTAARMASAFKGMFTALFVETSDFPTMLDEDKKRLRANIRLAQQLGARIETVYGDDIPRQIAEYARISGITKIVIGRSSAGRRHLFGRPSFTEQLTEYSQNLDIYIIPDTKTHAGYHRKRSKKLDTSVFNLADFFKTVGVITAATLIGFLFQRLGFTETNIITVYIFGALIIAVTTTSRLYSLLSSLVSVLVFNFFFTEPLFTLQAYENGYPVTFLIMFLAAFLTGSFAHRLKRYAKQAAQVAYRTKVLLDTNQLLQQAKNREEIAEATANQLIKLLGKDVVMYLGGEKGLDGGRVFCAGGGSENKELTSDNERSVAIWTFKNNKRAGATTDTLPSSKCLYLALRAAGGVFGVTGICVGSAAPDSFEYSIAISILDECALALENEQNLREKEAAVVLAENERLRANLLRAISHDLRTPLTSISGNASNLISNGGDFDDSTRQQIYTDIYDDSMWLINLVENLLSVTRIEEGRMNLNQSAELMDEVITEALRHVNRKRSEHKITVKSSEEFILAQIDARLIVQVIINIVDNAIKYTPPDSEIMIETKKRGNKAVVKISDNGGGIADSDKEHIFDMFYSGANEIADSRRSLGLGLSLCKSIVHAHGGTITVSDNTPHGAVFTFTLPAEEVQLHE